MSETDVISMFRAVTLPFILVLVVAIALRQLDRLMRHRLFGEPPPSLLLRDLTLFGALSLLIVGPAVAGLFGQTLGDKLVWVVFSTIVALVALGVWGWFEFFIVGRKGPE